MSKEMGLEKTITLTFNGVSIVALPHQMLAAVLLENGERVLRQTRLKEVPRGIFCGIGICFDCLMIVDDVPNQRACLIRVREGMRVQSQ